MPESYFKSEHINATSDDLAGNHGIGRYIFLPGSDARAKEISEYFDNTKTKKSDRGHHLYLGTLSLDGKKIDVASISTGMGCPSTEIVLHELYHLGGKRFLRVGTCGSLQPNYIKSGDIINVQASVRDEDTTKHYVPSEFPALASLEFISAILLAAGKLELHDDFHTGIVHCKSSLYARELGIGPHGANNLAYMNWLAQFGVLASEMETSALFIQSQLYNYQAMQEGYRPENKVLAGAILSVTANGDELNFERDTEKTFKNSIELAVESIKTLAIQELID